VNHAWKRRLKALGIGALGLSSIGTVLADPIAGQGTWETTLEERDLDGDVSTAEAYYDTVLDIIWLVNADAGETKSWADAKSWAEDLDLDGVAGRDGWRLPRTRAVDFTTDDDNLLSHIGEEDRGHNISAPGGPSEGSARSEMAHMYHNTLGNLSRCDLSLSTTSNCVNRPSWGLVNTGPFANLHPASYWSETEFLLPTPANSAWSFNFDDGNQGRGSKVPAYFAWAVYDGDFGTPINVTPNQKPIADAGAGHTVHVGDTITLSGTASDPDEHYPLTYAWSFTEAVPAGTTATLSDPNAIDPNFVADRLGDYTLELVVTDDQGLASDPVTVTISTYNTAPVADANVDQVFDGINQVIQLNGINSFDGDGDLITASWSFDPLPAGSSSTLNDPASLTPSFTTDVYGTYVLKLTVTDEYGAVSVPDSVMITFNNAQPIADAGDNQSGMAGDVIYLDGTGSSDANNSPLNYAWSFVSRPEGSAAVLSDTASPTPQFVANMAGSYSISLVVNDDLVDSEPSAVDIEIVDGSLSVTDLIQRAIDNINAIPRGHANFTHRKAKRILTKTLNRAIRNINRERYFLAKIQLRFVERRMNGCIDFGEPDRYDWIKNCGKQNLIRPDLESARYIVESYM